MNIRSRGLASLCALLSTTVAFAQEAPAKKTPRKLTYADVAKTDALASTGLGLVGSTATHYGFNSDGKKALSNLSSQYLHQENVAAEPLTKSTVSEIMRNIEASRTKNIGAGVLGGDDVVIMVDQNKLNHVRGNAEVRAALERIKGMSAEVHETTGGGASPTPKLAIQVQHGPAPGVATASAELDTVAKTLRLESNLSPDFKPIWFNTRTTGLSRIRAELEFLEKFGVRVSTVKVIRFSGAIASGAAKAVSVTAWTASALNGSHAIGMALQADHSSYSSRGTYGEEYADPDARSPSFFNRIFTQSKPAAYDSFAPEREGKKEVRQP